MNIPKGSRYTKGFGRMYRSTGRFGGTYGKSLTQKQRGTHVFNVSAGKYAELVAEPVETWLQHEEAGAEKFASAVQRVVETYHLDLTQPSGLACLPFLLSKVDELLGN